MGKKDFKGGLDSLLGGDTPKKEEAKTPKATTDNKPKEIRATFIVSEELHEKLKAIAYFERDNIKDSLDKALTDFISKYEKANGLDYLELYKNSQ